jgi:hypothetical protein
MDTDFIRGATTGSVIGLAAAGLIVLVIVRSVISKVLVLGLIAALAVGALTYRTSLEHCLKTCSAARESRSTSSAARRSTEPGLGLGR